MSPVENLPDHLAGCLIAAENWNSNGSGHSDFDLNPELARPEAELRAAAVLVALYEDQGQVRVVLTRRADTLNRHGGQIAFPGGRMDPGETPVMAALREAFEEVALDPAQVRVLGLGDGYVTGTGFHVVPVVGWLDHVPVLRPDPDEVAEVFDVPWDFLMDPANHRQDHYDMADGTRRLFWAMPFRDRYIWGATAGMLRGLGVRLYGQTDDAGDQAA